MVLGATVTSHHRQPHPFGSRPPPLPAFFLFQSFPLTPAPLPVSWEVGGGPGHGAGKWHLWLKTAPATLLGHVWSGKMQFNVCIPHFLFLQINLLLGSLRSRSPQNIKLTTVSSPSIRPLPSLGSARCPLKGRRVDRSPGPPQHCTLTRVESYVRILQKLKKT